MNQQEMRSQIEEQGFCIVENALTPGELELARAGLERGVAITRQIMGGTHIATLDPNDRNIRVNNLPAIAPVFIDLLVRSDALDAVAAAIGENYIVSNFTANIALPGSGSMNLHSDQALVIPGPWHHPWAMNVIWCLDDVHEGNGATRYLPGSHRFTTLEEVPENALQQTLPFEAPAGSFVAMEGRLWHTSGCNTSVDEQRRMMFAYYSTDFIRPQANWALCLPAEVQSSMDARTKALFGVTPTGNTRIGAAMTRLPDTARNTA
ncbi:phytanoyl-CoA dioxygenase family protein [Haliea sp. E17]|uniref:phytanoyl-CoA dioxygenase family protein n=1 Tax=Haliea sp. E17 TaxID=3401576 RepID=UPI003AAACA82